MKIILLSFLLITLMFPLGMSADTLPMIPEGDDTLGTFDTNLGDAPPYVVAARIINYSLGFLGILSLILTIYAGFLWMWARGNEEEVTKAKKILEGGFIGLILVLASYGISYYVFNNLVNITY